MSAPKEANAEELGEGLVELVRIAEALEKWQSLPWGEVREMARSVGPLILAQLVGRGLWNGLTPAVQAQVHWIMAEGHTLSGVGEEWASAENEGPHVARLHAAAARFAMQCGTRHLHAPEEPSSSKGTEHLRRLEALPEGWRDEAFRRAMMSGDIVGAVASAVMSINVLRSVYDIDVRRIASVGEDAV
ncbi:hypothetical protein ACFWBR_42230 [Streptomyces sp. NPDC060006]|uniref:hypothetical protein n=1 Tax=unclassified Streptomyces TaxID=2593676 RepID=UPI003682F4E6